MTKSATTAAEKATRLLSCPFCGGKGQIVDDLIDPENESAGSIFHAVCQNDSIHCPMQPGIYACDTAEIAAKAWNTRAQSAGVNAAMSALKTISELDDCGCDHTTEDCCTRVNYPCGKCIAAAALAQLEQLKGEG